MLNQLAAQVKLGGALFVRIFEDYQNHAQYAEQIKGIEVHCDELAAKITQKLNSTFITPIDREDIYLLVTELDDVIDMINDLARRLEIYGVSKPRPDAIRRLFREEKDPIEVIKWMSIYEELENSIDRCKDVAEALEAVVVKNK